MVWLHVVLSTSPPDSTRAHLRVTLTDSSGGHEGKSERIEGQRWLNGHWAVNLTLRLNSPSASTIMVSPFDYSWYPGRTKALSRPQWPLSPSPITCPLRKTVAIVEKEDTEAHLAEPSQVITYTIAVWLLAAWPAAPNDEGWQWKEEDPLCALSRRLL